MRIKILMVGGHKTSRQRIKFLFKHRSDIKIVGEIENKHEALEAAIRINPNIIIIDTSTPGLNGISSTRQLHASLPNTPIIVISAYSAEQFAEMTLNAGASGYILKDHIAEELPKAILTVINNTRYLSPKMAQKLLKTKKSSKHHSPSKLSLTRRKREVLQLIAQGLTAKQIASNLHVKPKTILTHRRQIMDRLNINSISELTKLALRENMTA